MNTIQPTNKLKTLLEVLFVSTKLGLTSFGGPVAHLGYFHNEYIRRRKWLDEKTYGDLVALCQFLPGPASSQVGIGIGVMRAGILGGILAFIGFTLPSVIALILFALLLNQLNIDEAGYGATQAVPGPLFTFAAYLGTVINGWQGGLLATIAIFLPAFLLILGTLPFWDTLRKNKKIKGALMGVNAAVVGILISAFYQPIWSSSIFTPADFALASLLFSMLVFWKLPPWVIVATGAIGGWLITLF